MKLTLHELHNSDWAPEPISAMAYHSTMSLLAVVRENSSNIEVYFCSQTQQSYCHPHFIFYIPGEWMNGGIPALAWVKKELIATTTSGCLLHLDIWSKTVKARLPILGMIGLSIAVNGSSIVVGSDSGALTCFTYEDNAIQPSGNLPAIRGKILCLAWCSAQRQLIAAGTDDGTIVFFDLLHRLILNTVSLPSEPGQKNKDRRALVWDLCFVPVCHLNNCYPAGTRKQFLPSSSNHTLICAESTGQVSIWDVSPEASCFLQQRFATHRADVLTLCCTVIRTNRKGALVCLASGVDPMISMLQFVVDTQSGDEVPLGQWVLTEKRYKNRDDAGDARVILDLEGSLIVAGISGHFSIFPSGGVVPKIVRCKPVHQMVTISSPIHDNTAVVAMLENSRKQIGIYALKYCTTTTQEELRSGDIEKLVCVKPKLGESILTLALSPKADYLAYSDSKRSRILQLVFENETFQEIKTITIPTDKDHDDAHSSTSSESCNGSSSQVSYASQQEEMVAEVWPPAKQILFLHLPAEDSNSLAAAFVEAISGNVSIRWCNGRSFDVYDCVKAVKNDVAFPVCFISVDSDSQCIAMATVDFVYLYSVPQKQMLQILKPIMPTPTKGLSHPLRSYFRTNKELIVLFPCNKVMSCDLNAYSWRDHSHVTKHLAPDSMIVRMNQQNLILSTSEDRITLTDMLLSSYDSSLANSRFMRLPEMILDLVYFQPESYLVVYQPVHFVECLQTKKFGF